MANDKEFLIRVKADIQDALNKFKKLGDGLGKTGKEGGKAGDNFKRLQDRLEPVAASARKFRKELKLLYSEHRKGEISTEKLAVLTRKLKKEQLDASKSSKKMAFSMRNLTLAAAAYFALKTSLNILKDADAYAVLQQRIKTATKATGDYVSVSDELHQISIANGVALKVTVGLFQNLARTAPELKATNAQMLKLTNLVQQLGIIGGSTQTQLSAGLLQFSQGLAGGVFRAEEFNSIIENIPELAARIAKGLGLSTGQLRKAVIEGRVLSVDVFDSLIKQAGEINSEIENIPNNIKRAQASLDQSGSRLGGIIDKELGSTTFFAGIIKGFSEILETFTDRLDNKSIPALERRLFKIQEQIDEALKSGSGTLVTLLTRDIVLLNNKIAEIKSNQAGIKGGNVDKIEVNKNQSAVNNLLDKLRMQRDTLALTNDEIVIHNLNLKHASEKEIELALRIQDEISARKKLQELKAKDENSNNPPKEIDINKEQKSIDTLINKLRMQRDTLSLANNELVIYNLNLAHASDKEIDLALKIQDEIAARREQQELTAEGTKIIQENKTAQEELADTLARLDVLYEKGALGAVGSAEALDQYARAVFNATDRVDELGKEGKDVFDRLLDATEGWGKALSKTLADMAVDGKANFKDLADSIIKEILRILIFQQLIKPVLGGLGLLNAPTKHSGGLVGSSSGATKSVSPFAFSGARRYHNGGIAGLRSNEVPTILEKGEEVLTRKDPRHRYNQGGSPQNVKVEIVNKGTPNEATQTNTRFDGNDFVVSIVLDDLDRGGRISGALNNKFGPR